jgi:hypothetical protein
MSCFSCGPMKKPSGVSWCVVLIVHRYGFVFGQLNDEYLSALCGIIRRVSEDIGACRVLASGYSMGGFGAYQLGCHSPQLFDVLLPVAGYGRGTLESPSATAWGGPQPESSKNLEQFLDTHVSKLVTVPTIVVVHAPSDSMSSFRDTEHIVETIQNYGGSVELVRISNEMADSDPKQKKKVKTGHNYFHSTFVAESSETVLYNRLRVILSDAPGWSELASAPSNRPVKVSSSKPLQAPGQVLVPVGAGQDFAGAVFADSRVAKRPCPHVNTVPRP